MPYIVTYVCCFEATTPLGVFSQRDFAVRAIRKVLGPGCKKDKRDPNVYLHGTLAGDWCVIYPAEMNQNLYNTQTLKRNISKII